MSWKKIHETFWEAENGAAISVNYTGDKGILDKNYRVLKGYVLKLFAGDTSKFESQRIVLDDKKEAIKEAKKFMKKHPKGI